MVRGGCDIGSLTRLRKKKKVSLGYKLPSKVNAWVDPESAGAQFSVNPQASPCWYNVVGGRDTIVNCITFCDII